MALFIFTLAGSLTVTLATECGLLLAGCALGLFGVDCGALQKASLVSAAVDGRTASHRCHILIAFFLDLF